MSSALGTFGRPGMVMMSPQIATMKPAPAASRTSRTGTVCCLGAQITFGSVVKHYWVLAMQIGRLPKPSFSHWWSWFLTEASAIASSAR